MPVKCRPDIYIVSLVANQLIVIESSFNQPLGQVPEAVASALFSRRKTPAKPRYGPGWWHNIFNGFLWIYWSAVCDDGIAAVNCFRRGGYLLGIAGGWEPMKIKRCYLLSLLALVTSRQCRRWEAGSVRESNCNQPPPIT
jgi:hypothetical protein